MSKLSQQREAAQRQGHSRIWKRPGRLVFGVVGVIAAIIGALLQRHGFERKYTDIGITTLFLVWLLLSAFRPEWRRVRFWAVLGAITAAHIAGWWFLTSAVEKLGFPLMFVIVVAELVACATLIIKAIPGDEKSMGDYIDQW